MRSQKKGGTLAMTIKKQSCKLHPKGRKLDPHRGPGGITSHRWFSGFFNRIRVRSMKASNRYFPIFAYILLYISFMFLYIPTILLIFPLYSLVRVTLGSEAAPHFHTQAMHRAYLYLGAGLSTSPK